MTIEYRPTEVMMWTIENELPELSEFYFLTRDWRIVGHDQLVFYTRPLGILGLHAAEGGFFWDDEEDARYSDVKRAIGRLWSNKMPSDQMWWIRMVFCLCGIPTFDSEVEAVRHYKYKMGLV